LIDTKRIFRDDKTIEYNLLNLLNNLINYSKIERSKDSLVKSPFKLKEIIEEITLPFKTSIIKKGLNFKSAIDYNIPQVYIG
jgi:signal transduction histidine kinase